MSNRSFYVFVLQGVTHQQWYLFNDFLIEPIDKVGFLPLLSFLCILLGVCLNVLRCSPQKTEAAQFDVSWKVPAILYYAKRNYHFKYDLRSKFPDLNLIY